MPSACPVPAPLYKGRVTVVLRHRHNASFSLPTQCFLAYSCAALGLGRAHWFTALASPAVFATVALWFVRQVRRGVPCPLRLYASIMAPRNW